MPFSKVASGVSGVAEGFSEGVVFGVESVDGIGLGGFVSGARGLADGGSEDWFSGVAVRSCEAGAGGV